MATQQNTGAHSAQVEMRLRLNGSSISITHMGPDFLFVQSPVDYPPGLATIYLRIDASEESWTVRLPQGISAGWTRVPIALE